MINLRKVHHIVLRVKTSNDPMVTNIDNYDRVDVYVFMCTVVRFLKAKKGKSQYRKSLKQQRFLKIDKSERFFNVYLVTNMFI